jgi:hypothetical protein
VPLRVPANYCLHRELLMDSSVKIYFERSSWRRRPVLLNHRTRRIPSCSMLKSCFSDGICKSIDVCDHTFMIGLVPGKPKEIIKNSSKNLKEVGVC